MLDIITPQRFYQLEFKPRSDETITTVIDLKNVTEITLTQSKGRKEICIVSMNTSNTPRAQLDESVVETEVYAKLVSAWTTYKLSTER